MGGWVAEWVEGWLGATSASSCDTLIWTSSKPEP